MENKTKKRMMETKKLIESQQYDKARAILITIDHPTAEKWLSKLPAPQPKIAPNKNAQTGCGCTLLIILCSVVIWLMPTPASHDTIALAAWAVDGVMSVRHEGVVFSEINPQVWVDVCITNANPDIVARSATEEIRKLSGIGDKEIMVSVTNATNTLLYHNGNLIATNEREFC